MRKSLLWIIVGIVSAVSIAANPQVTLHITGGVTGDIVLELYPEEAPITVENFINYVQTGFYDGLIFHRVMSGFMIQGGGFDPDLNFKDPGEMILNESDNWLSNLRGTLAMARQTHPHTAGSQFFINHDDNSDLDAFFYFNGSYGFNVFGYTVFGHVISGMDVVDAIAEVDTETVGDMDDVPVNDVIISSAELNMDVPACLEKLSGDIDGDCDVDLADLAALAENWTLCNSITGSCS